MRNATGVSQGHLTDLELVSSLLMPDLQNVGAESDQVQ